MSKSKDKVAEKEQNWNRKALAERIKCGACGQRIPYGEQKVFFSTGLCGHCAHKINKKD
jgi:hypothetical protein